VRSVAEEVPNCTFFYRANHFEVVCDNSSSTNTGAKIGTSIYFDFEDLDPMRLQSDQYRSNIVVHSRCCTDQRINADNAGSTLRAPVSESVLLHSYTRGWVNSLATHVGVSG
jgi:hypothetical protein